MLAEIPQYTPRPAFSPLTLTPSPRPLRLVRVRFPKPLRRYNAGLIDYKADYRLCRRRDARRCASTHDVPPARSFASQIEHHAGVHAKWLVKQAAEEGISKLFIEIDIPGNLAGGRKIDCKYIKATLSSYAGYKCYWADARDCYDVGPIFATFEEARHFLARRRPHLRRGNLLNIVGVDTEGHTVDGMDLLERGVYRYGTSFPK